MDVEGELLSMAIVNGNYAKLQDSYLFTDIAKRVAAFTAAHPEKKIIKMGIGDVTLPLAPCVVDAMKKAVEELGHKETFRGYGPEQGYEFLHEAIQKYYARHGVKLDTKDIFISDGAKSDCGNITDLFEDTNVVLVPNPVYPVYADTNVMRGRKILYMNGTPQNHFLPMPDDSVKADIIYLCSPNNPTGAVYTREQLEKWVAYARKNDAIILYDAAYEAYIHESDVPHSIYEIEGARSCAVEFRSFSKTAGFTGVRCGYTVVPEEVKAMTASGEQVALNHLWNRRQCTKFNGTSYITQRGAEAIYTAEGQAEIKETIAYYMENARLMREGLHAAGFTLYGGVNAPYIWVKAPEGLDSWSFFEMLLHEVNVVGTPGVGFGPSGEGFLRLTAFGKREDCQEAMNRIKNWAGR